MKHFIILFLLFAPFRSLYFTSDIPKEDVYIYITNFSSLYNSRFDLPSDDSRFKYDSYYFTLKFVDPFEKHTLYSLGKKVNIDEDKINYIVPESYFKDKSNYEIHLELSLMNDNNRIFIITDIPNSRLYKEKDKLKKHIIWEVEYTGTLKRNFIYTDMGGNILLQD